jgi:hypothetical protein
MKLTDLKTRNELGTLLSSMKLFRGAEIGVAYGENAERILEQCTSCQLFLVDPWETQDPVTWPDNTVIGDAEKCFVYCNGKLSRFKDRIVYIRQYSNEASKMFEPNELDFIYIDGNHKREAVESDLVNWYSVLKSGGIMGGHDYLDCREPIWSDVKPVVDEFIKRHNLTLHLSDKHSKTEPPSWWFQKP